MGHLLTEILLLLAAAALAGLGLGWALFNRTPQALATGQPDARLARELEEAKKAAREASAREREVETRAQEAADRSDGLAQALEVARREVQRLEAHVAAPPPPAPVAEDPELPRLRDEVSELRAALASHGAVAEAPGEGDAGLRAELDQALSAQTRLEALVAELEAEAQRNRQTLAEQEATLDSLTRELTGRGRPATPATKVVGAVTPAKARTPTLSAMRAVAGKGATERLSALTSAPEDSSPVISVRPASGRTATLAEGSPARGENLRPATVRQSRVDPSASRPPALPTPSDAPLAASGALAPEEATVSVSLGDLVARIDAAPAPPPLPPVSKGSSPEIDPDDESTVALDLLSLVGRIDATTDAVDEEPPAAPPEGLDAGVSFADASATIQQQRPSFLEVDDLRILKGVGPVTEVRMREFGLATWRDLLPLDEAAIERLADHMKMTVDRVRPWIDQARALEAAEANPAGEMA
jgi:predicted flap endonuclease-1-like 5' DNA nuclease